MPKYVEMIRGIVKLDKLYIPNVLYVGKLENSGSKYRRAVVLLGIVHSRYGQSLSEAIG